MLRLAEENLQMEWPTLNRTLRVVWFIWVQTKFQLRIYNLHKNRQWIMSPLYYAQFSNRK